MTKPEQPSIDDAFDLLAKNTELSLGEYTSITQSQADIELYLTQHLNTFSSVLYGAFSRKTIVSPLAGSIVDMLILYRDTDVKLTYPSKIFSTLSEHITNEYPDSYNIKGRNILMLPIKNFLFKIQPAYPISDHTYMLSAEYFNDWVSYDITSYNDIFTKENVRHKGQLIAVIRMIKTWNRVSGNLFNGYYLELLVTDILSSYQITSYAETVCHILKVAVSKVVYQKEDPANTEFQIEGLNDIDNVISAMVLLEKSYQLATEAIEFEKNKQADKALENWNNVFPTAFPTSVDIVVAKAKRTGIKGADALRMMMKHK